jgi:hypothetical protein
MPVQLAKTTRRRLFAVQSESADARRRRMLEIRDVHIKDEVFRSSEAVFERLINRLEDDMEPFAFVISAASGAGKTHILDHIAQNPRLAPFTDKYGLARPLLRLSAPSPCTLKTLGAELLRALTGVRMTGKYYAHDIWARVRTNLYNQNVSVLMIDEMNHVFETVDANTRQVVISTLKALLLGEVEMDVGLGNEIGALPPSVAPHPIGLVLSGMPSVRDVIGLDQQLARRCKFKQLKPLSLRDADGNKFRGFVKKVGERLGFNPAPNLGSDDMMLRLHKAAGGYRGRAAFIIKEAAYLAVEMNAKTVDRLEHFASVFEEIYEVGDQRNPFIVADPEKIRRLPEIEKEVKSRLRGAMAIDPAD